MTVTKRDNNQTPQQEKGTDPYPTGQGKAKREISEPIIESFRQAVSVSPAAPDQSPRGGSQAFIADNGILMAVGPWKDLQTGRFHHRSERVVLPGLVNPHVHLEYTDMLGELPSQQGFTNWVDQMVQLKRSWEPVQYQRSWLKGLEQQIPCGTTLSPTPFRTMPCLAAWRNLPGP